MKRNGQNVNRKAANVKRKREEVARGGAESRRPAAERPKANVHGVYVRGVEKVRIPLPKSSGSTVAVRLVHVGGSWRVGHEMTLPNCGGNYAPVTTDGKAYGSRTEAIRAGLADLLDTLENHRRFSSCNVHDRRYKQVAEGIEQLRRSVLSVPSPQPLIPNPHPKENALITIPKNAEKPARATSPATRVPRQAIDDGQSAAGQPTDPENGLHGRGFDCPLEHLVVSPYNPRRDFPAAEIQNLAESIKTHGLLQPIVVRPRPQLVGTYEIVAGERRYQAAKKAGLKAVPVIARQLDDAQARELCVVENLERKDLSAIEEAEGFQMILQAEGGPTQTELAKRLGVTQGHIANRLRLLKLPATLQKQVISGEILASHAREFLVLEEFPALLTAASDGLYGVDRERANEGQPFALNEIRQAIVVAVDNLTRPVKGTVWTGKHTLTAPASYTAEQRAALAIAELPCSEYDWDKREARATNAALWDKLAAEAGAKKTQRDDAKAEKESGRKKDHKGTKSTKGKGTTEDTEGTEKGGTKSPTPGPQPPTPAELKRRAEEEESRRREQAAHTKRRVADFRNDWTRYLIGTSLAAKNHSQVVLTRLAWYFATLPTRTYGDTRDREQMLAAAGVKPADRKGLLQAEPQCLTTWLASMFYRAKPGGMDGVQDFVPDQDLAAIAATLDVDHEAAWRKEQAGPLSEEYWNIHTKDQLAELGEEVGVYIAAEQAKSVAVKLLASPSRALPLPRELAGKKRK